MADNKRGFLVYDYYHYAEQDPVVDRVRTAMKDTGMSPMDIQRSGEVMPKARTIKHWLNKKTRSPKHATVCSVMGAMGFRQEWVRDPNRKRNSSR
jgi:hypothetical protein